MEVGVRDACIGMHGPLVAALSRLRTCDWQVGCMLQRRTYNSKLCVMHIDTQENCIRRAQEKETFTRLESGRR